MKRKRANNFYLPMEGFEPQVLEQFAEICVLVR
jgi:hypothetical protein